MVLDNIAEDLSLQMQQAGVVEDAEGTFSAPAEDVSETVKRISNKLKEISDAVEQLELRLGRVEERLGL
jgi:archaellum component FlaC